jgi:hypothetical protein
MIVLVGGFSGCKILPFYCFKFSEYIEIGWRVFFFHCIQQWCSYKFDKYLIECSLSLMIFVRHFTMKILKQSSSLPVTTIRW